jgi:hypothetical protein
MEYTIRYMPDQGRIALSVGWRDGEHWVQQNVEFNSRELGEDPRQEAERRAVVQAILARYMTRHVSRRIVDALLLLALVDTSPLPNFW